MCPQRIPGFVELSLERALKFHCNKSNGPDSGKSSADTVPTFLAMNDIKSFESYFDDESIIEVLATLRARHAKKRHDEHFYRSLSKRARNPAPCHLDRLFPPRRLWKRPRREARRGRSAVDINKVSICVAVRNLYNDEAHFFEAWAIRLKHLLADIRLSVLLEAGYEIESPSVIPIEKRKPVYRPIAFSRNLKDRVIVGQCARYLRDVFDKDFSPSSYAFRCSQDGKTPNHHDAVNDILKFRAGVGCGELWVAECDIKKFYDCVHHKTASAAFYAAVERVRSRDASFNLSARADHIFQSYLRSYSFPGVAIPRMNEWFAQHDRNGSWEWAADELREYWEEPFSERIGVPQGGALSCLIANLVLHAADEKVHQRVGDDPRFFYARYCDDMIMLHPDRGVLEGAFQAYVDALAELMLPIHKPTESREYSRSHWRQKSRSPYCWGPNKSHIPWISFVGYQIRYDGLLRVRPSSISKELEKQVKEIDKVLKVAREKPDSPNSTLSVSHKRAIFRVKQRLISMSVGRVQLGSNDDRARGFCWTSGFRLLRESSNVLFSQLKFLDRGRQRQLKRLKSALARMTGTAREQGRKVKVPRFYGFPFSYYGQFARHNDIAEDDEEEGSA